MQRLSIPVAALGIVALWFLLPVVLHDVVPQDAVPMLVAAELADDHPDAVYDPEMHDLNDLEPIVREATCRYYPDRAQCLDEGVAFVSPPLALPILALLPSADRSAGIALVRVAAIAAMAAAFVVLARRCRAADDVVVLAATAVVLVVDLQRQVELGQTTALLVLLAAIPVSRTRAGWHEWPIAAGVAVATAFKLFPIVLVVPMLVARRWRLVAKVGVLVALLAVLAQLVAPEVRWGDFADVSRALRRFSLVNPNNASLTAVLRAFDVPGADVVGVVLGAALASVFVLLVLRRHGDEDLVWASTLPLTFLVLPQVWNHYLVVVLPLLVLAAARGARHPERWFAGAVVAAVPYELLPAGRASQVLGLGLLLGALVTSGALAMGAWAPSVGASPSPE